MGSSCCVVFGVISGRLPLSQFLQPPPSSEGQGRLTVGLSSGCRLPAGERSVSCTPGTGVGSDGFPSQTALPPGGSRSPAWLLWLLCFRSICSFSGRRGPLDTSSACSPPCGIRLWNAHASFAMVSVSIRVP